MSAVRLLAVIVGTIANTAPPRDYPAWTRVAKCESGGWRVLGSSYPDPLGISRVNWIRFGGRPQPPGPVNMTGRIQAIRVADRMRTYYRVGIPDQTGCAAW
jgi:hypothetical protein